MKQEHLFEAIGLVDDRLVEEAADARRTATPWKKWAALAACLVLVIGIGSVSMSVLFRGCGADMTMTTTEGIENTTADSAATAPESAETEETTEESTSVTTTEETTESTAEDSAGGEMESAGVIRAINCDDGTGLTASRRIQIGPEPSQQTQTALVVEDYYVENSGQTRTVTFRYPLPDETVEQVTTVVDFVEVEHTIEDGMVVFQVEVSDAAHVIVHYLMTSEDSTFRVNTASNGLELTRQLISLLQNEHVFLAESNLEDRYSVNNRELDPAVEEYYFTFGMESEE